MFVAQNRGTWQKGIGSINLGSLVQILPKRIPEDFQKQNFKEQVPNFCSSKNIIMKKILSYNGKSWCIIYSEAFYKYLYDIFLFDQDQFDQKNLEGLYRKYDDKLKETLIHIYISLLVLFSTSHIILVVVGTYVEVIFFKYQFLIIFY